MAVPLLGKGSQHRHTLSTVRHRQSPYSLLIDIMRLGGGLCAEKGPFNRNPARGTTWGGLWERWEGCLGGEIEIDRVLTRVIDRFLGEDLVGIYNSS